MRPHARTIHPKPGLPSEIVPSVKTLWMVKEPTITLFAIDSLEVHSELSFDLSFNFQNTELKNIKGHHRHLSHRIRSHIYNQKLSTIPKVASIFLKSHLQLK